MKIVRNIIIGFVLVILLIVGMVFMGTKGVDKAAEATIADFQAGHAEKVYNDSILSREYSLEQFNNALGPGSGLDIGKMTKLKWTGRGFNNGRKYIYGTFRFPDGSEHVLTFTYIEEDGELKLFGIRPGAPDTSGSKTE